jgi:hypothetical protein
MQLVQIRCNPLILQKMGPVLGKFPGLARTDSIRHIVHRDNGRIDDAVAVVTHFLGVSSLT